MTGTCAQRQLCLGVAFELSGSLRHKRGLEVYLKNRLSLHDTLRLEMAVRKRTSVAAENGPTSGGGNGGGRGLT